MDKELFGFIIAVLGILTGSGMLRIIQVLIRYRKGEKMNLPEQIRSLTKKLDDREDEIKELIRLNGELLAEVASLKVEIKYLKNTLSRNQSRK